MSSLKFKQKLCSFLRITKNINNILSNINLNNYVFELTPTESSAGGTLIYVANHLADKPRTDLQIYKKRDLESTFIEIINSKKSNIIVGCIYRHPNMDLNDFNSDYLNSLLAKFSEEKKTVFLLGDYHDDLLKYEQHSSTNEFLDSLASSMFLSYIIQPTRVTSNSKTIIDIFSNIISSDIIWGNLTGTNPSNKSN